MSDSVPKQTGGSSRHAFPEYEWLARIDPAYDQARRDLAALVWSPAAPALAVKYREIIAAVILGCRGYPTIASHLEDALTAGASLREVLEAFETAAILGGFPVLHYALPFLIALHERSGGGRIDGPNAARAVAEAATVADTAAATEAVSRGMREWVWLNSVDPDYDAARRDITAFVWTPRAPALPVRIRELVASVVLAYRAFPTLDAHLRRAVREGASIRELVDAMETAALPGGFPVLHYALPFLRAIHADIENGTFA